MEYQFRSDPTTGMRKAIFSFEHEIFGPWLEVEVGGDAEKLTAVLEAIDNVQHGHQQEITITGSEYSLQIDSQDVFIKANASLNGSSGLSEELTEQGLGIADGDVAMCGLEDFRNIILAWSRFITS